MRYRWQVRLRRPNQTLAPGSPLPAHGDGGLEEVHIVPTAGYMVRYFRVVLARHRQGGDRGQSVQPPLTGPVQPLNIALVPKVSHFRLNKSSGSLEEQWLHWCQPPRPELVSAVLVISAANGRLTLCAY
jgi:hypothetical protein